MPTTPTFPMLVGGRLRRAHAGRGRPVHDGAGRLVGFATVATRADLTDAMAAGLAEVLATAELPAGAANLLTADVTALAAELLHAGVEGVDLDALRRSSRGRRPTPGSGCCGGTGRPGPGPPAGLERGHDRVAVRGPLRRQS